MTSKIIKTPFSCDEVPNIPTWKLLEPALLKNKEAISLIDDGTGKKYTAGELHEAVRKVASGLARREFGKGDILMIYSQNCAEYIILSFAVWALGGILNAAGSAKKRPVEELAMRATVAKFCGKRKFIATCADENFLVVAIETASTKGMELITFGDSDQQECTDSLGSKVKCTPFSKLLEDDGTAFPTEVPIDPEDDVAWLHFSSGTTGPPKGAMNTYIVLNALATSWGTKGVGRRGGITLQVTPLGRGRGMLTAISAIYHGGAIVISPGLDEIEDHFKIIEKYQVTNFYILTSMLMELARSPSKGDYDLSSLNLINYGGSRIRPDSLIEAIQAFPKAELRNMYKISEGGAAFLVQPTGESFPASKFHSTGLPGPFVEAKIVDTVTGEICAPERTGELCLRCPYIMKAYINNPEATRAVLDNDGWLHTGDTAHYDSDDYIYVVDKLKETIYVSIEKMKVHVSPTEVVDILLTCPLVKEAAVIGIHDPDHEGLQLLRAFVVPRDETVTADDIILFVDDNTPLAQYNLTGGVKFVGSLPKDQAGKVNPRELHRISSVK